jgi:hypothetical protein
MAYFSNQMNEEGLPAPWAVQATSTTDTIPIITPTLTPGHAPVSSIQSLAGIGTKLQYQTCSSSYPGITRRSKHGQPKKPRRQMEFKCKRMHCPGDENIIPLYRPAESDQEDKVESILDIAEPKTSSSQQEMSLIEHSKSKTSTLDINELRAENERHHQFMKDIEETTDWLSDDEYEEPEMNPKYS